MTRSHPHLLDVIKSIEHGDDAKGFSDQVFKMVGHGASNSFASITRAITRPRSTPVGMDAKMDHYEAQLLRLSANYKELRKKDQKKLKFYLRCKKR